MGLLRDMESLAEVVFVVHDVGEAFMGDVKKINKGLYVSNL
jgi:hypothetical protein